MPMFAVYTPSFSVGILPSYTPGALARSSVSQLSPSEAATAAVIPAIASSYGISSRSRLSPVPLSAVS